MNPKVTKKVGPLVELAVNNGWEVETTENHDEYESVQVSGTRYVDDIAFGFVVAFGVNPASGRAVALCMEGETGKVFILTVDMTGDRYWYAPLSASKTALVDPIRWTGLSRNERSAIRIAQRMAV